MTNRIITGLSGITALQKKELRSQIKSGVINETIMQAFIEHRNPWESHILTIDRTVPFDTETFIGKGWSIWKGPIEGNGLQGEEEQDQRSLSMSEITLEQMLFKTGLKQDEISVSGEDKIKRHRALSHIMADAKIGQILYEEEGQKTLWAVSKRTKLTWFELPGTTIRSPEADRSDMCLYQDYEEWRWCCRWLGSNRCLGIPSLVLKDTSSPYG